MDSLIGKRLSLRYDGGGNDRMGKPKGKVKIAWSPNFAYAIGLMVTDGNLSPDGRHLAFVSNDLEQIKNFQRALGISCLVSRKQSGFKSKKQAYVVQFGDVLFYRFLLKIGLMPNKSKVIADVHIPDAYYFDFIRGLFDGDGHSYSYLDPRWKSSFMFYIGFSSASRAHTDWLRNSLEKKTGLKGHVTIANRCYQLKYAKNEALGLVGRMYYEPNVLCLNRKHLKILKVLSILGEQI